MPPIDEGSILRRMLMPYASLSSFLTESQFRDLFPPAYQTHPMVAALYRDLRQQRVRLIEAVSDAIDVESRAGTRLARQVARERARSERAEMAVVDPLDWRMEADLSEPHSGAFPGELHSVHTVLPALEKACAELEAENDALERDSAQLIETISAKVGSLSDLRYGKFSRSAAEEDVGQATIEGVEKLARACDALADARQADGSKS